MIKEGDKVICIKEAHYTSTQYFLAGEKYQIEGVFLNKNDTDTISVNSVHFYLEHKIYEYKKFSDHFITLAEWRDKQIDSILNE